MCTLRDVNALYNKRLNSSREYMKTKKKYGFLIVFFTLLISCFKTDNQITVLVKDGLSESKVEIRVGFTSINRKNDLELFSLNLKTVFKGNDKGSLNTDFGENDFLIIYDDSYYYSFRHFIYTDFKSSYPEGHDYKLELFKQNDSIFMNVNITGEQPMEFKRVLIKKGICRKSYMQYTN